MKKLFSVLAFAILFQANAQVSAIVDNSNGTGNSIVIPINRELTIVGYGNSIMAGQGASTGNSFFELSTKYVGGKGRNYGVPGNKDFDQLRVLHKMPNDIGKKALAIWEPGTNSLRRPEANDTNSTEVKISNLAVKTFIVERFKDQEVSTQDISVKSYGPNDVPGATFWTPYPALLPFTRFVPSNATAQGSKLEYSFYGTSCYVNTLLHGNYFTLLFSTFNIYIDNVLVEEGNNFAGGNADYAHSVSHVFTGLPDGFHTLIIYHNGDFGNDNGRTLSVEKFGTLKPPSECSPAIVSAIHPMDIAQHGGGLTQAGLDNINLSRKNIVNSFASLGYPLYFNPLTGVTAADTYDGLHFGDPGNYKIYLTYKAIIDQIYQ